MGMVSEFDEQELVRSFGRSTYERGREYAAQGRVGDVRITESKHLTLVEGDVLGSRSYPYRTTVSLVGRVEGDLLDSRCSCPVVSLCKHAVAVLVAAHEIEDDGGVTSPWERTLDLLLDEMDDVAAERVAGYQALGLELALAVRSSSRARRWPGDAGSFGDPAVAPIAGLLRLRPVVRGKRDRWVRTGVSWSDAPFLDRRAEIDPEQARVLADLLVSHRAANRQTWPGAETDLSLATFGPQLWRLLTEAVERGIALIPANGLRSVTVLDEPVRLSVDINGGDLERAHLALGVQHDGEWFAGERIEVLGPSGHGVALWTDTDDAWDVVLAPLERPAGPQARRALASAVDLVVTGDEMTRLVGDYLPRLGRHIPVTSSDATVRIPEVVEPRLVLSVTWADVDDARLAWTWRYRVGEDDRIYDLDDTRGLRGIRQAEREAALLAELTLDEEQTYRLCEGKNTPRLRTRQEIQGPAVIGFLEDTLVPLEASGQVEIEEIGTRPDFTELVDVPRVSFSSAPDQPAVTAATDWLDLQVVISVGSRHLGLAQVLEAMTLGAERVILRDGAHVRIDRPEFAELREMVLAARELVEQPRDAIRVSRHDLGLWAELADLGIVDAQAAAWTNAALALRDLDGLPLIAVPDVKADLRHYQVEGFRWLAFLWRSGLGGILADDMGLGKTMQTLALIAHARGEGAAPFLVVAPTSVVSTWAHEAATFTPGLVVRAVTESRARRGESLADVAAGADLVITSYTLFRMEAASYVDLPWGGLVLDEAQMVKNHEGKTYQAVRRLDVPFRLALTGTPMENRLMELWSLLSIVAPGLYPYPQRFTENVAHPVEREGDAEVLARFRRRIKPFVLRRTKDLVAKDLPPKQEQVLEVALTPKHRKIYQTHLQRERQNVLGLLGDFDRQRIAIFKSLTTLRQLSLDASLVDEEYAGVGSAKIDVLVDHLTEVLAEGHRALVFSQFTSFLRLVRSRLDAEGITSKYLDGRTRHRGEVVSGFKRGDAGVFLISLKAGGVGLTLTEADYVFVLDPWWNPAVEAQAVDRAHRIGQQRPVIVYRLVATDTIEEKVMELKARKADLFARVLDGGGGVATPLSADDVRALFAD